MRDQLLVVLDEGATNMITTESFAIIDVGENSESCGKILLLLDDAVTARDMAQELQRNHLEVVVRRSLGPRESIVSPEEQFPRSA